MAKESSLFASTEGYRVPVWQVWWIQIKHITKCLKTMNRMCLHAPRAVIYPVVKLLQRL